jgi:hypothetical protein
MTREERRAEMHGHMEAQERSGTSRRAYCEQHGLKLCVLNQWFAKRKQEAVGAARGFVPVEVSRSMSLEVHYPNGVRLLLPTNTSLERIGSYIRLY